MNLAYQESGTTELSLTQCFLNYPNAGDTSTTIPAATKTPSQGANELSTEGYTASATIVGAPANAPSTTGGGAYKLYVKLRWRLVAVTEY